MTACCLQHGARRWGWDLGVGWGWAAPEGLVEGSRWQAKRGHRMQPKRECRRPGRAPEKCRLTVVSMV